MMLAPLCIFSVASAASIDIPATSYPVTIDGNPREAFLLGARFFPMHGSVTGLEDGSVKAYLLAVPDGLYVAVLSTEPDGGKGLLRPMPWAPPGEAVLCDWMAVRLGPPESAVLLLLGPGGYKGAMDRRGTVIDPGSWKGESSIFGCTWAGEWLIPWGTLGVRPGGTLQMEVLRGRKIKRGKMSQEDRSQVSPLPGNGRWGGDGLRIKIPKAFPSRLRRAVALSNYEVRPFVPESDFRSACCDAAPAGEIATAWLEVPAGKNVRITVGKGVEKAEIFRLDFWWQAGKTVQRGSLIPSRVARGAGDVFVGERLFPMPENGFKGNTCPMRIYVRGRVPRDACNLGKQEIEVPIKVSIDGKDVGNLTWNISISPALPDSRRLAGLYYMERNRDRWQSDLKDMRAHGVNAATCPGRTNGEWKLFQATAEKSGIDGKFALHPDCVPKGEEAWGYVTDEPATASAISRAEKRAAELRKRGLKTWAALAWPNSFSLDSVLDGIAVPPGMEGEAEAFSCSRRWVYFQGLREDPFYNRVWASLLSRAPGLDGFWVFCYAPSRDRGDDDWRHPIIRYDALVDPDGRGGRLQTVQWEALRDGIVDGRLIDALGPEARRVLGRFPGAVEALHGRYWKAKDRGWSFEELRTALVDAWRDAHQAGGH